MATSLSLEDTFFFFIKWWQTSKLKLFFKCRAVTEGGKGGWSEDETIDCIMHVFSFIVVVGRRRG